MKKYIILFLAVVGFLSTANAQFDLGESFVSGSYYTSLQRDRANSADVTQTSFSNSLSISVGKFVKDNKAIGWSLAHSLSLYKVNQSGYMKPLQNLSFGILRFVEYYKPLGGKFAIYARPSIGIGYNLGKQYSGTGDILIFEDTSNKVSLNVGLETGLAWRFGSKWALYGSVAFSNPVSISTSFNKREYADGTLSQKETEFAYNFNPAASSGQIGLGFRYFCGKK